MVVTDWDFILKVDSILFFTCVCTIRINGQRVV